MPHHLQCIEPPPVPLLLPIVAPTELAITAQPTIRAGCTPATIAAAGVKVSAIGYEQVQIHVGIV